MRADIYVVGKGGGRKAGGGDRKEWGRKTNGRTREEEEGRGKEGENGGRKETRREGEEKEQERRNRKEASRLWYVVGAA